MKSPAQQRVEGEYKYAREKKQYCFDHSFQFFFSYLAKGRVFKT
jgi:hypothetical protein